MIRSLFHIIPFLLLFQCVIGQNSRVMLEKTLTEFVNDPIFDEAQISLSISELSNSKEILNYQGNKSLPPASTLKLLYSLVAVDQFGPEYRFQTKFYTQGEILEDGSLEGDLIIKASGDPSFASKRIGDNKDFQTLFNAIWSRLQKSGIKCIDGKIMLILSDRSYPVCSSWPFEDLGNYYAGGAWGFNFNENEFDLIFRSAKNRGQKCEILRTIPYIKGMTLENHVISGSKSSGDNAFIFGIPGDYYRTVKGSIPAAKGNFSIRGSLPHPPLDFLALLADYLEEKGIYSEGTGLQKLSGSNYRQLANYESPNLLELSKLCNDYSINLYSESFGKLLLAKENKLKDFHYPSEEDLESIFSDYGVKPEDVKIMDACGLSPFNLISANSMTRFLAKMYSEMERELFLAIIPHAGRDGNAKSYMQGKKNQDRVWVKSGSIQNILNFAGVYRSVKNDKLYAFCIFTQHNQKNSKVKGRIEEFLDRIISNTY